MYVQRLPIVFLELTRQCMLVSDSFSVILSITRELLSRSGSRPTKSVIFISHSKRDLRRLVNPAPEHIRSAGLEAYEALELREKIQQKM